MAHLGYCLFFSLSLYHSFIVWRWPLDFPSASHQSVSQSEGERDRGQLISHSTVISQVGLTIKTNPETIWRTTDCIKENTRPSGGFLSVTFSLSLSLAHFVPSRVSNCAMKIVKIGNESITATADQSWTKTLSSTVLLLWRRGATKSRGRVVVCPLLMWLMSVDPKQCSTGCCCEVLESSLRRRPEQWGVEVGR